MCKRSYLSPKYITNLLPKKKRVLDGWLQPSIKLFMLVRQSGRQQKEGRILACRRCYYHVSLSPWSSSVAILDPLPTRGYFGIGNWAYRTTLSQPCHPPCILAARSVYEPIDFLHITPFPDMVHVWHSKYLCAVTNRRSSALLERSIGACDCDKNFWLTACRAINMTWDSPNLGKNWRRTHPPKSSSSSSPPS